MAERRRSHPSVLGWAFLGRIALAVTSGLLFSTASPPLDLGPFALVALVPLLWAWRGASVVRAGILGLAFGLAFLGALIFGLHHVGLVGYVALVVVAGLYYALIGVLVALFAGRGYSSPWLTGVAWVVVEGLLVRWPLGGLAASEAGVTLHDVAPARALASVGGVALVSFVVVVTNGLVLDGALALWRHRRRAAAMAGIGLSVLVLVGAVADLTRFHGTETGRIRFALLQGFDLPNASATQAGTDAYATARHFELASHLRGRYDLIVFPESALDRDPELDPALRKRITDLAAKHHAVVLVNARTPAPGGGVYNANLAYGPNGVLQGVYAKQHLVPFGEYVPWRDELSFVSDLRQIPYDFVAGDHRQLFRVARRPVATVICYESAYSGLVRSFVRDGAEAVVVSTSDRAYGRSGIASLHLAQSQMRAAETGRPVLQASISGISGVIDADGTVHDMSELFENTITTGTVATVTGETLSVRFGDWLLILCSSGLLVTAVLAVTRPRTAPVD
ncbi:MAG: apolipoprotein N-acyltransferase [Acidimicrobiia bacterium]|nr:apolipoprotein N-acyltransferase [Acidimicrobiia bacterium]